MKKYYMLDFFGREKEISKDFIPKQKERLRKFYKNLSDEEYEKVFYNNILIVKEAKKK